MHRARRWSWSLLALAVLAMPFRALAQEIALGVEFQVNAYTTDYQSFPWVAADSDGDFVVAWQSYRQDGSAYGVFARRFSSAGTSLSTELQVNAFTGGSQYRPVVTADAVGNFVVVWGSADQDGSSWGVFARRFSSAGTALAGEFQVNVFTASAQHRAVVAEDADGNFVVAWQSYGQDGSASGIFARRFSSAGTPLATELKVNTHTSGSQYFPSVASDADGDFVIAWTSFGQDDSASGVFAQRFASTGTALAAEFQVSSYTSGVQFLPSVAADADGDFVVAWASNDQDGSALGIFAQRFSSAGIRLATEFQVNAHTVGIQFLPSVATGADGDFVVAWSSYGQDASPYQGVLARRFSSAGVALTADLQVNSYTGGGQVFASAAADAAGDFVVTWSSNGQDGSGRGVFAQRFGAPAVLDIDADGSVGALTDGLLILRYLFGLTGPALVDGAVDSAGCHRCDAGAIEVYLATLL